MNAFIKEIQFQLQQDHDYYHNSLMNQSLHLFSGCLNITSMIILVSASFDQAMLLFLFSWTVRQSGHFFFEPKDFDEKANKTFEQKEEEKIGANLERKRFMIGGLVLSLIGFLLLPDKLMAIANTFGYQTQEAFNALMFCSFSVFIASWVLRALWLITFHGPLRGLSWFFKILYDPINDIVLYKGSPIKLLKRLKNESLA